MVAHAEQPVTLRGVYWMRGTIKHRNITESESMNGENRDCPTGCMEESHMIECYKCGLKYHYGVVHFCPTGVTYKFKVV